MTNTPVPPFNQPGTLDGVLIRVGGRGNNGGLQNNVPVHLAGYKRVYICKADRLYSTTSCNPLLRRHPARPRQRSVGTKCRWGVVAKEFHHHRVPVPKRTFRKPMSAPGLVKAWNEGPGAASDA